ncbi:MAG: Gfo/Idh/MocA family oxidoreductase [Caldilineaceae bacterium]|nr:Gfo/Idh/MocA family oxidoreductase [Caldilineaceae bacterium]
MLNVAVVGIGNIGQNHSRIYQAHPDTELVAVVDVVAAAAAAGGERFGVPHFTSIPDLLASDVHVDMASVCTAGKENGGDHYEPTMALLGAGIPVLGEKPISNELPKAREMVARARERNLRYGINLNHRFTPAALRAKEWVDAGRLGELNIINMTMWINNPNETSEHFHMRALHPHSLDVMRYFAGDVEKVQAFFKKGKGRAIWSNVQVNLLFRNGVIGHLTGSYDAGGSFGLETLEVVGSDGRFVLREACQHLEFYPRRSMETESYAHLGGMMAFPETFDSRIARWIEQNKADAAPEDIDASGEDALRVQTIIEGAIESWHTGKVVSV